MKSLNVILAGFAIAIMFACDKVTNPIVPVETSSTDTNKYIRNIFFEDYTGQDCPNCPRGTRTLDRLQEQYPNLIAVAVHAGLFAKPYSKFPTDYRTPAGDFWVKNFKIGTFPAGMTNRKIYSGTDFASVDLYWESIISEASKDPYVLGLKPTVNFNSASRTISSSVKVSFKDAYNDSVRVSALITEDHIMGKQNDDGSVVEPYEFNHMLRGTITEQSFWGEKVPGKKFEAKSEHLVVFPEMNLKPAYVAENCYLIVFAFNERTKEVLQVEKAKLIK